MLILIISDQDNRIIERYYLEMNSELMRVAYSILQSHFDAETAVQEAFLRIMSSIESFHKVPDNKKNGYCYMVVKNVSINMYKKSKQNNMRAVMLEDCFVEQEDQGTRVEEIVELEEELSEMKRRINLLDSSLKKPLVLRYAHGMDYRQIASIMNISEPTARKRVERAIRKLSEISNEGDLAYV
jgi:RNA polymerase sigma-70 factor (ECF subfamily)